MEFPAWLEKAKNGFMMGASAGMAMGLMVGTITVLTAGPPPGKTYLGTIGKYMIAQGSALGFFLSIGSILRNEERISSSTR